MPERELRRRKNFVAESPSGCARDVGMCLCTATNDDGLVAQHEATTAAALVLTAEEFQWQQPQLSVEQIIQ